MMEIQKIKIPLPMPIPTDNICMSIGIDPGTTHMGIAMIEGYLKEPCATLYQITMLRSDDAIERMRLAQTIMSQCIFFYREPMIATIEGSAFSSHFRQTELAEIRAAVALWCDSRGFITKMINPLTIRKKVFGNAKVLPHEYWQDLKDVPDAAQALACAYYPMM